MSFKAVYVMWLRELKRYFRAKSRIASSLAMPLLFLGALGLGFSKLALEGAPEGVSYIMFLIPGIIGMGLTTSSLMGGVSVLWDREFGFLKEIMVAPVSRLSIVIGRIMGGVSTSMIQGVSIMIISLFAGFVIPSLGHLLLFLFVMFLISATFMGFGLIMSSVIKNMQGFGNIIGFIMMPIIFLSGAFFPINNMPEVVQLFFYINPLTYGIDALRGIMLSYSTINVFIDISVLVVIAGVLISIGSYLFDKSESV